MPFNHVMIDLETLSARTNACIIQIAAAAFNIETGEIGPRFNAYVAEPDESRRGHVDVAAVGWWMQQAFAPAMGVEIGACAEDRRLARALLNFGAWLQTLVTPGTAIHDLSVWSHGATFDIPLLAAAYERCDMRAPWHYRAPRDTRTLFAVAPGGMPALSNDETRKHDAQYDCEYQVAQVCAAWAALREQSAEAQETQSLREAYNWEMLKNEQGRR